MKMITYSILCWVALVTAGCSSVMPAPKPPEQELIVDARVQQMARNEVIDAVKQCESSGLRAIPIYAKRKIGGYSVETVIEVTCGPKYAY
jgi:uncharacterized protein YceK